LTTTATAPERLDFADIQGGILRAYGNAYRRSSHLFFTIRDPVRGRSWLRGLMDHVTDATEWKAGKPTVTLNIALTRAGLAALGVPDYVIASFSQEFRDGMAARAAVLGDVGPSAPSTWEPNLGQGVAHVLVIVNATTAEMLEQRLAQLRADLEHDGTLQIAHEDHAQLLDGVREHFGYADGFAQPAVEGVTADKKRGGGVPEKGGTWRALAVGEFILGHEDEASRDDAARILPSAPLDPLGHNSTYMVWRKLEQDVALFRRTVRDAAALYGDEEKLRAKIVGRWSNGTPLVRSPDFPEPDFDAKLSGANDFRYTEVDPDGLRCPLGAHIRRSNPRDLLGFDGALTFRHRMIRRGIPYGPPLPHGVVEPDGAPRGLLFVCYIASISRQFEGVQVQWLEDGNIFRLGRDKDFLLRGGGSGTGKMTVPGQPPFFLSPQPDFVTVRGGEYLFVPGITALAAIADGVTG
jgi:Dyp-type peroxidase family